MTASPVGCPPTHGVEGTSASELSPLKARTPIEGASLITTDRSKTRRMTVFGAFGPSCEVDLLEFSAIKVASALPTMLDKSGVASGAYVLCETVLPSEIRMTQSSAGQAVFVRTMMARSLRKLQATSLTLAAAIG